MDGRVTSWRELARPRRPLAVALVNRLGRALERLGRGRVELSEAALLAAARAATGLDDLGDPAFRQGLARQLEAIEAEAALSPLGRLIARTNLVRVLSNRLRIEDTLRRHPEIEEQELLPPVVIAGLQRTGTTLLHRLLAQDSGQLRALASWEAINPAPWPEARGLARLARRLWSDGADGRVGVARLAERSLRYLAPDFFSIHPVEAHAPEEDCLLFDYCLLSTVPEATLRVPSYSAWLQRQDLTPAYRYVRRVLQLLAWSRPESDGPALRRAAGDRRPARPVRWVLKTPFHMEYLDRLLEVFPGAHVIQTHRDPVRALASYCSMLAHGRRIFSERVDPLEIGAQWSAKAERMITRSMAERARRGDDPGQFVDVAYAALVADPVGQVRRIYDALGLPLAAELPARLRRFVADNPQHKHGRHRYRPEDFGLDRGALERRFEAYYRRYDVPRG